MNLLTFLLTLTAALTIWTSGQDTPVTMSGTAKVFWLTTKEMKR